MTKKSTVILLFRARINIINKPNKREKYATRLTVVLLPVKATTEWNLYLSTPVSSSKRSLVRFSQSKIKIEAIRKPMNCPSRILPLFPSSHPADTITGIIATEYSGHLIAACQRCFLSDVEDFTDKLTRPVCCLVFPLRLGSSSCIGLFMSKGSNWL